jgi:hypothetical protein
LASDAFAGGMGALLAAFVLIDASETNSGDSNCIHNECN